jgi:hypothetical protein
VRTGRRTIILLVVIALLGLPAGVLRAMCADNSCTAQASARSEVPFCSLPSAVRAGVGAGYREGRSPDILAVTRTDELQGSTAFGGGASLRPAWPSVAGRENTTVPIVFSGTGVDSGAGIPSAASLDDVAATEARILGLHRPHPEVRSGSAITSIPDGERPRLVLQVTWAGVGSEQLQARPDAWPFLEHLMRRGAGTLRATTGSVPIDPAAQIATIGTGGLPYQHGITGTLLRNDRGKLVRAWGKGAPVSVIAALGDDLDHLYHQSPLVGVVGTVPVDRGAIGGNWYLENDDDDTLYVRPGRVAAAAARTLRSGYGRDPTPDLLAVVDAGQVPRLDRDLKAIVAAARRAAHGSVTVTVTATGSAVPAEPAASPRLVTRQIARSVPGRSRVVQATEPGGFFLDQKVLAETGVMPDVILRAVRASEDRTGRRMFADAFPGIAVSFARYC